MILRMKLHKVCLDFDQQTYRVAEFQEMQFQAYSIMASILRENIWLDVSDVYDVEEDEILAEVQERLQKSEIRHTWTILKMIQDQSEKERKTSQE